jgi:hypothetical protein
MLMIRLKAAVDQAEVHTAQVASLASPRPRMGDRAATRSIPLASLRGGTPPSAQHKPTSVDADHSAVLSTWRTTAY